VVVVVYCRAICVRPLLTPVDFFSGALIKFSEFGGLCTHEEYLGGISDLTGEMQRCVAIVLVVLVLVGRSHSIDSACRASPCKIQRADSSLVQFLAAML
jgi:hypothetical protein